MKWKQIVIPLFFVFICFIVLRSCVVSKNRIHTTQNVEESKRISFDSSALFLPYLTDSTFYIEHTGFSLIYNETHEQAEWVTYFLNSSRLTRNVTRSNDFRPDPSITSRTASHADYQKSGYDRGHLAPAADMAWSKQTMSESFFYSNMSPQTPGFNRGIWKKLEEQVRQWVNDSTTIHITTGPVLHSNLPQIGPNNVSVPEYYYKALLRFQPQRVDGIAFILPNTSSNKPLSTFAISIDSLETLTHLNFHHLLIDSIQTRVEAELCIPCWLDLE
jgi:endonuclease G, mitochondrial